MGDAPSSHVFSHVFFTAAAEAPSVSDNGYFKLQWLLLTHMFGKANSSLG